MVGNASSSLQGEAGRPALAVTSGSVAVGTTTDIATTTGLAVYNKDIEILAGNPVKIGGVETGLGLNEIEVRGDYAYTVTTGASDELQVYDVSDPTTPTEIGTSNIAATGRDIRVSGNYAYVVTSSSLTQPAQLKWVDTLILALLTV